MKIFISWSGERSRIFATAFSVWISDVIQAVETFVSAEDIDKGARWASTINKEIAASGFGIVCLTKDTIDRRWILFESGALSRRFGDKEDPPVATLVLDDMDPGSIPQPLAQFNPTRATKDDLFRLVRSINKVVGEDHGVKEARLEHMFNKMWDDLDKAVQLVADTEPETDDNVPANEPEPDPRLDEVVAGIRELLRKQVVNQPATGAAQASARGEITVTGSASGMRIAPDAGRRLSASERADYTLRRTLREIGLDETAARLMAVQEGTASVYVPNSVHDSVLGQIRETFLRRLRFVQRVDFYGPHNDSYSELINRDSYDIPQQGDLLKEKLAAAALRNLTADAAEDAAANDDGSNETPVD